MRRIGVLILSTFLVWTPTRASDATADSQTILPAKTGPIYCDTYYPQNAAGADGLTALSVRLTTEGGFRDAKVLRSSGSEALDAAAVACADNAHKWPATRDGQPIEIVWQVDVAMRHQSHSILFIPNPGHGGHLCAEPYPINAMRAHMEGWLDVSFHIGKDGSVSDFAVDKSSGHTLLDQTGVSCMSKWRYPVATRNGEPVDFTWHGQVDFELRD